MTLIERVGITERVREQLPHEVVERLTGVHYSNGLSRDPYNLETAVVRMGNEVFNLRHFTQGFHAFGGPGTGKSAFFIQTLAAALLGNKLQLGGVWCCVKPEEAQAAQGYLETAGAGDRAYVMSEGSPWRINVIY